MISVTLENLQKVELALIGQPDKVNQVLARAVNRAVTNVKSNISKKVKDEYEIKSADVKNSLKITKASFRSPVAVVRSTGHKIDLAKFKLNPKKPDPGKKPRPVYQVKVKKTEGYKTVPRGFLAYAKGSVGFFQRDGSARFPITRLMGPSIPEMIGRQDTVAYIEDEAQKMLQARLEHELQRVLGARPV